MVKMRKEAGMAGAYHRITYTDHHGHAPTFSGWIAQLINRDT